MSRALAHLQPLRGLASPAASWRRERHWSPLTVLGLNTLLLDEALATPRDTRKSGGAAFDRGALAACLDLLAALKAS